MRFSLGITAGMHSIKEAVTLAKKAEKKNLYRVFVGEDIFSREAFTYMSIIAVETEKIKIASGIISIYARNEHLLLNSIKAMRKLCKERFSLGVGIGGLPEIKKLIGKLPENKPARMKDIIKKIREDDKALEIYIGARGSKMLEIALNLCNGAILSGPRCYIYDKANELREKAEKRGKNDFELILWNPIMKNNSTEKNKVKAMVDTILESMPENAMKYIKNLSYEEKFKELCIFANSFKELEELARDYEEAGINEIIFAPWILE